jgi:uncharacterized protein YjbI with pentapeptide repeats
MAYTMIAERNNQKVCKQRESALIVLANAQVMQSEGWQVVIVDNDGSDFEPRAFEASLAERFSWYQVKPQPVVAPAAEPVDDQLEAEALIAAELEAEDMEAEELDSAKLDVRDVDEADFDEPDSDGAGLEGAELAEAETAEMEFEGEAAE